MDVTHCVQENGLWTPNEGIHQRYLKNWPNVADKICFGLTIKFKIGIEFSAVQRRLFPLWASVVRAAAHGFTSLISESVSFDIFSWLFLTNYQALCHFTIFLKEPWMGKKKKVCTLILKEHILIQLPMTMKGFQSRISFFFLDHCFVIFAINS